MQDILKEMKVATCNKCLKGYKQFPIREMQAKVMGLQSCVLSKQESKKKCKQEITLQKYKIRILPGFEPRLQVLINYHTEAE
jgi:hypothetical protein